MCTSAVPGVLEEHHTAGGDGRPPWPALFLLPLHLPPPISVFPVGCCLGHISLVAIEWLPCLFVFFCLVWPLALRVVVSQSQALWDPLRWGCSPSSEQTQALTHLPSSFLTAFQFSSLPRCSQKPCSRCYPTHQRSVGRSTRQTQLQSEFFLCPVYPEFPRRHPCLREVILPTTRNVYNRVTSL